jgi:hypothetical protein
MRNEPHIFFPKSCVYFHLALAQGAHWSSMQKRSVFSDETSCSPLKVSWHFGAKYRRSFGVDLQNEEEADNDEGSKKSFQSKFVEIGLEAEFVVTMGQSSDMMEVRLFGTYCPAAFGILCSWLFLNTSIIPRRRLINNIKIDLLKIGLGDVDWIGLAQDRYWWGGLLWIR